MKREIADKIVEGLNRKYLEFIGRNYTDNPQKFFACVGFHLYQATSRKPDQQLSDLEEELKQEFDSYEKCPFDYQDQDSCENARLMDAYVNRIIKECKKDINK